jgi:UBX domain-containing protein 1
MPGFRSMADLQNEKDEDKDKLNSYAGGEKSGLAVQHPDKDGQPDAWGGARHAMGSAPPEGTPVVTVYVYTDGFIVDNGPFRPLSEPQNVQFMSALQQGECPPELGEGRTGPVHVKVEQKGAPYDGKHPNESTGGRPAAAAGPPAFGGEGMQLGESKTATLDKDAAKSTVDASKAVTKLQVRFHDGSRKAAEFNEDAPVQEIFDFVAPAVAGASFQILGGFPPKPLTDKAVTLKDAGLCNAAVTVKLT